MGFNAVDYEARQRQRNAAIIVVVSLLAILIPTVIYMRSHSAGGPQLAIAAPPPAPGMYIGATALTPHERGEGSVGGDGSDIVTLSAPYEIRFVLPNKAWNFEPCPQQFPDGKTHDYALAWRNHAHVKGKGAINPWDTGAGELEYQPLYLMVTRKAKGGVINVDPGFYNNDYIKPGTRLAIQYLDDPSQAVLVEIQ